MIRFRQTRAHVISWFCGLAAMLGGAGGASGEEHDPTLPSPQIMARLTADDAKPTSGPATTGTAEGAPQQLRLRGIVLRDNDHGMALIAGSDDVTYLLTLRRGTLQSAANRVNIGGVEFRVQDFSQAFVVLHSLDGRQQYTVR